MNFSIQMFLISPVPDGWQRTAALRKHGTLTGGVHVGGMDPVRFLMRGKTRGTRLHWS